MKITKIDLFKAIEVLEYFIYIHPLLTNEDEEKADNAISTLYKFIGEYFDNPLRGIENDN